ncbi:hypothetical protein Tco_0518098 [Tanacetum coccineum]
MQEDQTGSDSGKLHVSLAGPNPGTWMMISLQQQPQGLINLKLITGERVLNDKPESHSGSMSSLKNLDDTVNFGDQFLHDHPTEDDQEKSKAKEESDSNIPDPSHQTVTSTPPSLSRIKNLKRVQRRSSKPKRNKMRRNKIQLIPSGSNDKVDLEEFDLKDSALFSALDKEVADQVKKTQEKTMKLMDDEDDDDEKAFSWIKPG